MRIAFIGQKGIPVSQGGVERHVEELATRLACRGHEVLVYARTTYKTGESILPGLVKIIKIPSLPIKGWDTVLASFLSTLDVIWRKVDVVHYHSIGPAFFILLLKAFKPSVKVVFTHHTYEAQRPQWGRMARWAMNLGEKVGMKWADEVIAISPTVAQSLETTYGRSVSVVPNGVSKFLDSLTPDNFELPAKYILSVSRLIRSKGLDHLINAFNLVSGDYPEYNLVIVGSPTHSDNDLPRLKRLAADNPKIHLVGWQPSSRLNRFYLNADLFVQPSEVEGLPITLLEAASYGLPVVASDIPEHTVILRSDSVLFRSANHIDLAAKIRMVIDDLEFYRNKAQMLSQRINQEFNWDNITENIIKIYSKPEMKTKVLAARGN